MRRRILLAAAVFGALALAGLAHAATTTCNVAASGGFANCLTVTAPTMEVAKAPNGSATPYRFQLYRFSDGARWGWWQWSDTNHHFVYLSLSGAITGQIDNLGSGTQGYTVTLEP